MAKFPEWLAALGARRADLIGSDHVRGQSLSHTVRYTGDWSASSLTGSVKAAPDAATELAVFAVSSPVFADGVTSWFISLSASQTAALPADGDANGIEDFVYDVLIDGRRLFGGLFRISGFVTEA